MITAKKVAKWIWTEFCNEMKYQKAPPVPASYRSVKFEVQAPRKPRWIVAIQALIALILFPVIFVMLMLLIGF